MMDASGFAIPAGFILLAVLLLWLVIGVVRWWLKLIAIVLVPAFGLLVWDAIDSYRGWPSADGPEGAARVLSVAVIEPDQAAGREGAIYVWLVPGAVGGGLNPFDYAPDGTEPRAHKLPYTRALHEKAEQARVRLAAGAPVMFGAPGGDSPADGAEGVDGRKEGAEHEDPLFYELPPPKVQHKAPE